MKCIGLAISLLLMGCGGGTAGNTEETGKRPNILLIVGDDMGYADLGVYGSEIATPNLDRLAGEGLQFTNYHAAATCSPTRAMLLSGVDNHLNGIGNMHEQLTPAQEGQPGYEGYLNKSVVSVATLIRDAGYRTYMAGKWHLGAEPGFKPHDRGFDRTYALMQGAADNYSAAAIVRATGASTYTANGDVVERVAGVHSSELYTDRVVEFIEADRADGRPFFAYLAFQAAHYPHQAPQEYIEKYRDVYSAGWDAIRAERIRRLSQIGILSEDHPVSPRFQKVPAWQDIPTEHRELLASRMAAYAGMIEHMDAQIGRLLDHLRETGELENTVVIFMVDNGPDFSQPNLADAPWYNEHFPRNSPDELGLEGSFSSYGAAWAQVSAAHLSGFKTFSTEGGLRVPLLVHYPKRIGAGQTDEFAFVTDLSATLLEFATATHPGELYQGRKVHPLSGKSLLPLILGQTDLHRSPDEWLGYELMGNAALFRGDHKATRLAPWLASVGAPGAGEWRLHNIKADPSELHDLADEQPELLAELVGLYDEYETSVGAIGVPDDFDPMKAMMEGAH